MMMQTNQDKSTPDIEPSEQAPACPQDSDTSNSNATTEAQDVEVEVIPPAPDNDSPAVSNPDHNDFTRLDEVVRTGFGAFMESGKALMEIRDRELWQVGDFKSWDSYCQQIAGLTKRHANRLISAAEMNNELSEVGPGGPTLLPLFESQLRPFMKITDPEIRKSIWLSCVEDAGGQPTAKTVSAKVAEHMAEDEENDEEKLDAPEEINGDVDDETPVIEVEAESITAQADATEDTTLPPQDAGAIEGEPEVPQDDKPSPQHNNVAGEATCKPLRKSLLVRLQFGVAMISREAIGECRRGEIINLTSNLAADIKEEMGS